MILEFSVFKKKNEILNSQNLEHVLCSCRSLSFIESHCADATTTADKLSSAAAEWTSNATTVQPTVRPAPLDPMDGWTDAQ